MALSNATKAKIARGLVGGYLTLQYYKEMKENYRKGDWLEAVKDTGIYAVTITPFVAPTFFFAQVAFPVTIGVGAGLIATAAIVEVTGIGEWEDVVEMALDPPTPKEWIEVVAPAIQSEVTEPVIEYVTEELWQKQLVDPIGGWLGRRERDIERVWEITRPRRPTWI